MAHKVTVHMVNNISAIYIFKKRRAAQNSFELKLMLRISERWLIIYYPCSFYELHYTLSQLYYSYQCTYPVPVYSQLAEPVEGCHIVTSSLDELFYDVTSMYLDSHEADNLQTLDLCEVWSDSLWELVQHSNLRRKAKLSTCSNAWWLKNNVW